MDRPTRTEDEPHDRMTRLLDTATRAIEASPEFRGEAKLILFLNDGDRGGIVTSGYESDDDSMVDLLFYLRQIFAAAGKDLRFMDLGDPPTG